MSAKRRIFCHDSLVVTPKSKPKPWALPTPANDRVRSSGVRGENPTPDPPRKRRVASDASRGFRGISLPASARCGIPRPLDPSPAQKSILGVFLWLLEGVGFKNKIKLIGAGVWGTAEPLAAAHGDHRERWTGQLSTPPTLFPWLGQRQSLGRATPD